jgi:ABC-type uncharacterized transport system auxiliary subunit
MPKKLMVLIALASAVGMMTGCLNRQHPDETTRYYTLSYRPPAQTATSKLACTLLVERFRHAPEYSTRSLLVETSPQSQTHYHYHKWRAAPRDMLAYFLARDLQASNRYYAVFAPGNPAQASYRVEGRIDRFIMSKSKSSLEAVVALTITLVRTDEPDVAKRIVFQEPFAHKQKLSSGDPDQIVAALSEAMSAVSKRICEMIYMTLKPNCQTTS